MDDDQTPINLQSPTLSLFPVHFLLQKQTQDKKIGEEGAPQIEFQIKKTQEEESSKKNSKQRATKKTTQSFTTPSHHRPTTQHSTNPQQTQPRAPPTIGNTNNSAQKPLTTSNHKVKPPTPPPSIVGNTCPAASRIKYRSRTHSHNPPRKPPAVTTVSTVAPEEPPPPPLVLLGRNPQRGTRTESPPITVESKFNPKPRRPCLAGEEDEKTLEFHFLGFRLKSRNRRKEVKRKNKRKV